MSISAKHILVDQKFEAEDLLKKISEGETFESLAIEFSKCPSGKKGGSLGVFEKGQMVSEFEKALLELKVGEVSGIVKTQFGYHLIQREPV